MTPRPRANRNPQALLWAMAASSLLLSCGQRDPHFAVMGRSQSYLSSGMSSNNKVDILWVIDNSGTMGPKQQNLASSINSFMSQFVTKQLDYKIAVVTTDIRPVDPAAPTDPNRSGQGACFVGTPTVITPTTPDASSALARNANVGFYGSADAHGLDAARLAFSEPNRSGCNAGFLRTDAFLAVIEFSDADDNTSATVNGLLSFLDGVKPPAPNATGGTLRPYFVSSMVVPDLTDPKCQALGPFSEVGYKFLDIAGQTQGTTASICEPDFSAGLLAVSTKILEATTAIHLVDVPDPATIVVLENGGQVANNGVNGWTYESSSNRIIFHGSAIPIGAGVILTVNYTPRDIVR